MSATVGRDDYQRLAALLEMMLARGRSFTYVGAELESLIIQLKQIAEIFKDFSKDIVPLKYLYTFVNLDMFSSLPNVVVDYVFKLVRVFIKTHVSSVSVEPLQMSYFISILSVERVFYMFKATYSPANLALLQDTLFDLIIRQMHSQFALPDAHFATQITSSHLHASNDPLASPVDQKNNHMEMVLHFVGLLAAMPCFTCDRTVLAFVWPKFVERLVKDVLCCHSIIYNAMLLQFLLAEGSTAKLFDKASVDALHNMAVSLLANYQLFPTYSLNHMLYVLLCSRLIRMVGDEELSSLLCLFKVYLFNNGIWQPVSGMSSNSLTNRLLVKDVKDGSKVPPQNIHLAVDSFHFLLYDLFFFSAAASDANVPWVRANFAAFLSPLVNTRDFISGGKADYLRVHIAYCFIKWYAQTVDAGEKARFPQRMFVSFLECLNEQTLVFVKIKASTDHSDVDEGVRYDIVSIIRLIMALLCDFMPKTASAQHIVPRFFDTGTFERCLYKNSARGLLKNYISDKNALVQAENKVILANLVKFDESVVGLIFEILNNLSKLIDFKKSGILAMFILFVFEKVHSMRLKCEKHFFGMLTILCRFLFAEGDSESKKCAEVDFFNEENCQKEIYNKQTVSLLFDLFCSCHKQMKNSKIKEKESIMVGRGFFIVLRIILFYFNYSERSFVLTMTGKIKTMFHEIYDNKTLLKQLFCFKEFLQLYIVSGGSDKSPGFYTLFEMFLTKLFGAISFFADSDEAWDLQKNKSFVIFMALLPFKLLVSEKVKEKMLPAAKEFETALKAYSYKNSQTTTAQTQTKNMEGNKIVELVYEFVRNLLEYELTDTKRLVGAMELFLDAFTALFKEGQAYNEAQYEYIIKVISLFHRTQTKLAYKYNESIYNNKSNKNYVFLVMVLIDRMDELREKSGRLHKELMFLTCDMIYDLSELCSSEDVETLLPLMFQCKSEENCFFTNQMVYEGCQDENYDEERHRVNSIADHVYGVVVEKLETFADPCSFLTTLIHDMHPEMKSYLLDKFYTHCKKYAQLSNTAVFEDSLQYEFNAITKKLSKSTNEGSCWSDEAVKENEPEVKVLPAFSNFINISAKQEEEVVEVSDEEVNMVAMKRQQSGNESAIFTQFKNVK